MELVTSRGFRDTRRKEAWNLNLSLNLLLSQADNRDEDAELRRNDSVVRVIISAGLAVSDGGRGLEMTISTTIL